MWERHRVRPVSQAATIDPATLHASALCLDGACPMVSPRELDAVHPELVAGGVDAVLATVAAIEGFRETADVLGRWLALERGGRAGIAIARSVGDIRRAHGDGETAITFHLQGGAPFEDNVDLVDVFHALGVRVVQLTYNHRNLIGDGCLEEANAGLSAFGRRVVERLNELRIAIDVTHVGEQTSLEAIALASAPVIASHSNARALCDSPRNLPDELIKAVVGTGGMVGLCGFPAFVSGGAEATLEQMLDHADYISELVGPEHIGLGLDFADEDEDDFVKYGYDPRYYPPPPWTYPAGIGGFREWPNITAGLLTRGYSENEIRGILGENFLRVFATIWGS